MSARALIPPRLRSFLLAALILSACLGGPAAASQEDLLESLVEKNEAAWQKIQALQSIQYTLEREWLDRQSQQPFHGVAQVKQKGNCTWYTYRSTVPGGPLTVVAQREIQAGNRILVMQKAEPNAASGQTREAEQRLVVNDKYVAKWPVGNPFAYRWDHNSVETMDPRRKALPWGDFLPRCFGTDGYRFREATQRNPDVARYDAVRAKGRDGKSLCQIRRFYPKESPTADLIWVIDPERGYLAVESTFYADSETPVRRRTMRVDEVAPGLWYPVACEEVTYAAPSQTAEAPAVEGWTKTTVKDLKLNEPLPDEQFDIEALRLKEDKPDIVVFRTALDGLTSPYVYRDGKLVPQDGLKR